MNKCLNCGKDCINKYCSISCQNSYKRIVNEKKYNLNPRKCENCGENLDYNHRKGKYCSSSCSAIINNKGIRRHRNGITYIYNLISDEDFISYLENSSNWREVSLKFGYRKIISIKTRSKIIEKAKLLGLNIDFTIEVIKDKTKKEIFELSKNWQSARTAIRKDACKVYENSGKEYTCSICGYSNHVEIAHIKSVSSFNDDSILEEINDINNLIALCPNHHWEYDNGILKI